MLNLTRGLGQRIHLHVPGYDTPISIVMTEFRRTGHGPSHVRARVGIEAPQEVKIYRAENDPLCPAPEPEPIQHPTQALLFTINAGNPELVERYRELVGQADPAATTCEVPS